MKFVDLSDVVRSTGDINEKFDHVVKVLSTATLANTNAVMFLIDAVKEVPGFDVEKFKKALTDLQNSPPTGKDVVGPLHSQLVGMFKSRLD